jgi:hypothetical protein
MSEPMPFRGHPVVTTMAFYASRRDVAIQQTSAFSARCLDWSCSVQGSGVRGRRARTRLATRCGGLLTGSPEG